MSKPFSQIVQKIYTRAVENNSIKNRTSEEIEQLSEIMTENLPNAQTVFSKTVPSDSIPSLTREEIQQYYEDAEEKFDNYHKTESDNTLDIKNYSPDKE